MSGHGAYPDPYSSGSNPNNGNYPNAAGSPRGTSLQLTAEEARVLKECESDSLYYRCLPMMLAAGAGVHYAVQTGKLTPHPALGPLPKMGLAVFVSYVIGRVSYLQECTDRILKLPNSPLAEEIRRSRYPEAGSVSRPNHGRLDHFQRSDVAQTSEFAQESEPKISAGDDAMKTEFSDYGTSTRQRHEPGARKSFEDLRNENRLQYAQSMYAKKTEPPAPPLPQNNFDPNFDLPREAPRDADPLPPTPEPSRYRSPAYGNKPKKNAYGDNWDE